MNDELKYGIVITSMFKKDLKLAKKRGYDLSLLNNVVNMLAMGQQLAEKTICCSEIIKVAENAI